MSLHTDRFRECILAIKAHGGDMCYLTNGQNDGELWVRVMLYVPNHPEWQVFAQRPIIDVDSDECRSDALLAAYNTAMSRILAMTPIAEPQATLDDVAFLKSMSMTWATSTV